MPEENLSPNIKASNTEEFVPGDKRYVCFWNDSDVTLYISVRYSGGGITNFGIEPRGKHTLFVGDAPQGTICWQYGSPLGSTCPNSVPISAWVGNCI